MQVEIDEVVSRIRVTDGGSGLSARELQRLIDAVLRAVDDRLGRERRRGLATDVADDGRGGISRETGGQP
ncbi:hypothetical protein SAMN06265365_10650 [Tistlia consotensis]|uniref:Uncharacterized protein n=1 Tax=Tistlia consotensis USBA 355 TaxID=560819 RepID=A0A1Y6BGY5_9PROT|nr:hypothetical protein [Tistlia consotensis]SMF02977.1 hypothetical protein SAMN05428998_103101 [Tistlia consotensis USBA 355]SNR53303.1 hypothetical protein SAMN06265365_10650 [Tistlia consotensis]